MLVLVDAEHATFSVRVPAPLAEALRCRAVMAERTLAAEVRLALRRHVEGVATPRISAIEGAEAPQHKTDPLEDSWTHANT